MTFWIDHQNHPKFTKPPVLHPRLHRLREDLAQSSRRCAARALRSSALFDGTAQLLALGQWYLGISGDGWGWGTSHDFSKKCWWI